MIISNNYTGSIGYKSFAIHKIFKRNKNTYEQLNFYINYKIINKRMSNKEKNKFQKYWPNYSFKKNTQEILDNNNKQFYQLNENWIQFYNNN